MKTLTPNKCGCGGMVDAADLKSVSPWECGFKSHHPYQFFATLAQMVEHLTCNEDVVGSIPTGGSTF